jgi:hypothetical protein
MKFDLRVLQVLTIAILLSFAPVSCTDDEDSVLTFLEVHGGTQWKFDDPGSDTELYLKINESEANPFELWLTLFAEGCYAYQSVEDDGTPEILENTADKLVIRVEESNQEYTVISLNVSQNVLTVKSESFENGQLDDDNVVILFANDDDISDIEICAF